ncbi:L-lactate dehydrogenase [Anaerotignum sp. MB30-C6]|uniref:L-lactate dehydrogenase n=1 Tax=Anaerotignum sp. MB30-C6 TaxID=3070814 RepID=UPI0027DB3A6C|nr:L-lactate dehydrogenase [Anaerotignum sp. MB30-C6]WMI81220.1 L-lactate dehydrogenase [Anaerotignum sp. MB30-C6]
MKTRSVGIIGVGHVGAHCAYSLAVQGIVDELVLVDINEQKAISECQDLRDSVAYLPHRVEIRTGGYGDLKDCDVVVVSVGVITKSKSRLDELHVSIEMVNSFVKQVVDAGFDGIFAVITNPCDIIARQVHKLSGFDKSRVFGTGTGLDSSRLKAVLSRETGIDHKSLVAYTLGEHGDSQMAPWSHVSVNGKPLVELAAKDKKYDVDKDAVLKEAIGGGWVTFAGKGCTEFGISSTLARFVYAIFHDEKVVMPCSTQLNGEYGQHDIFISTPCVIGKNGVEEVLELNLTEEEMAAFQHSCDVIRTNIGYINEEA